MAKGFYLGSRLRRYARANQFGVESPDLKAEILGLMDSVEGVIGSNIKGTLVTDVFQLVDSEDREHIASDGALVEDDDVEGVRFSSTLVCLLKVYIS